MRFRFTTWIVTGGMLLLAFLGGPSMVLCVGHCGHVEFETVALGEHDSAHHDAGDHGECEDNGCEGCVDFRLELSDGRVQETFSDPTPSDDFTGPAMVEVIAPSLSRAHRELRPVSRQVLHAPPLLESLTTVRLLI